MAYEIRQNVIDPVRVGFDWVQRRLGRPANRYEEASIEIQQEENFHYRPLWDPDHEIFDPAYSALRLADWYSFTDPRQYYYYTYNQSRTKSAEQLESALQYADDAGVFDSLGNPWHHLLLNLIGPLRHFEYGAHLIMTQMSRFSYGTTIEQAAIFSAFDHLGNAQQLTKVMLKLPEGLAALQTARQSWMEATALQPLRRYVEDVLVLTDWGEQWVAMNLALGPYLYPIVFDRGEDLGRHTGLGMAGVVLRYFLNWYRDDRQWSDRLMDVLIQDPEYDNRTLLAHFLERWRPQARMAVSAAVSELQGLGTDRGDFIEWVEETEILPLLSRLEMAREG